jgi:pimeloyl-ACP methyl ester carboxylesterase
VVEADGKVKVRNMILSGDHSFIATEALGMAEEMFENVKVGTVKESGHYLAEENPEGFVDEVLAFVESR